MVYKLYSLQIEIEPLEEGGYLATSPVLPGFLVEGETMEEVLHEAPIVAQALLEALRDLGKPLPATLQPISIPFTTQVPVSLGASDAVSRVGQETATAGL